MALLLLPLLILASNGHTSDALWCVCRSDVPADAIQKTLDYACGAGADCLPIHGKGACYDPNTVVSHCSYATNSLFQKDGQTAGSCVYSGTALLSTTDPSYGSCSYPGSVSVAGTGTGTAGTLPTTTTPTTTSPFTTATPGTPANNFSGGVFGGLTPSVGSSSGITATDGTGFVDGGGSIIKTGKCSIFFAFVLSSVVLAVSDDVTASAEELRE